MEVEVARRLIAGGAQLNRDSGQGWTPLVHAIDIERDSAAHGGQSLDQVSTTLTELLLALGAVVMPRAIEVANAYGNHKAFALLSRSKDV